MNIVKFQSFVMINRKNLPSRGFWMLVNRAYVKYALEPYTFLMALLISFILSACNKEEIENIPSIAGFYAIESLRSDIEVALGNNRIVSHNLVEQIEGFSFESNFLEIRPNSTNDKNYNYKLISIPVPHPHVYFEYPYPPDGHVLYTSNSLNGIGYTYEFNETTKVITLIRTANHHETEKEWGRLEEINLVDANTLRLIIEKKYYDFKSAAWKTLRLTALYRKIH